MKGNKLIVDIFTVVFILEALAWLCVGFKIIGNDHPGLIWSEIDGAVSKIKYMGVSDVNHRGKQRDYSRKILLEKSGKIGTFQLDEEDGIFLFADRVRKEIKLKLSLKQKMNRYSDERVYINQDFIKNGALVFRGLREFLLSELSGKKMEGALKTVNAIIGNRGPLSTERQFGEKKRLVRRLTSKNSVDVNNFRRKLSELSVCEILREGIAAAKKLKDGDKALHKEILKIQKWEESGFKAYKRKKVELETALCNQLKGYEASLKKQTFLLISLDQKLGNIKEKIGRKTTTLLFKFISKSKKLVRNLESGSAGYQRDPSEYNKLEKTKHVEENPDGDHSDDDSLDDSDDDVDEMSSEDEELDEPQKSPKKRFRRLKEKLKNLKINVKDIKKMVCPKVQPYPLKAIYDFGIAPRKSVDYGMFFVSYLFTPRRSSSIPVIDKSLPASKSVSLISVGSSVSCNSDTSSASETSSGSEDSFISVIQDRLRQTASSHRVTTCNTTSVEVPSSPNNGHPLTQQHYHMQVGPSKQETRTEAWALSPKDAEKEKMKFRQAESTRDYMEKSCSLSPSTVPETTNISGPAKDCFESKMKRKTRALPPPPVIKSQKESPALHQGGRETKPTQALPPPPVQKDSVSRMVNIYTKVIFKYKAKKKDELSVKVGQRVKQKAAANDLGMAFGWTRSNKIGPKKYGFYPVSHVILADGVVLAACSKLVQIGFLNKCQTGYGGKWAFKQVSKVKDKTKECVLFSGTSSEVNGMTIDWSANNVYWTDSSYDVIIVQNYGTCPPRNQAAILIGSGLEEPIGIVAYPKERLLFWSDAGYSPYIGRSTLSGKAQTHIVERNLFRPSHMTLDFQTNRLYWLDSGTGLLSSCGLDGFDRKDLIQIERAVFAGLVVSQHRAYVTEQKRRALYVVHLHTQTVLKRIVLKNHPNTLQLVGSGTQLTDITDPCNNQTQCSGICVRSTSDAIECLCSENEKSVHSCGEDGSGNSTFPSSLLYTRKYGLVSLPENFPDMKRKPVPLDVVYSKSYRPLSVASNVHQGDLYFSQRLTKAILKVGQTKPFKVQQIILTVGIIEGLVVDWVSRNLYWTDSHKKAIMVSDDSGQHIQYLIRDEEFSPRFLAIHPGRRRLYWMTSKPAIYQSYLDGSYTEILIYGDILKPTSLVLDIRQERIYWSDAGFGHIASANLDGSDRRILYSDVTSVIKAMAIVKDYVIYADWYYDSRGLHAISTKTGHHVGLQPEAGLIRGLTYNHHSSQPLFQDPCGNQNGGCSHLCLPNFYNYTCKCGFGYKLGLDNRTCTTDLAADKFILIADQRLGGIYQLDMWLYNYHALPLQGLEQPYSVTYNPIDNKVYWSDVIRHTVNRAFLNGSHQEIILAKDDLSIVKLVIEENAGLMFYLDLGEAVLGVMTVLDLHHKTLIENITDARDFVIDAEKGRLIVSTSFGIDLYNMDGSKLHNGLSTEGSFTGMAVDVSDNRLYWYDPVLSGIMTSGLNMGYSSALRRNEHIQVLDVDPHFVYWIDKKESSIYRIRKTDGEGKVLLGQSSPFFQPVSMFVQRGRKVARNSCSGETNPCSHICLPNNGGHKCACSNGMLMKRDKSGCYMRSDERIQLHGLCVVPKIEFGETVNQRYGLVVIEGFRVRVQCLDGTVNNSQNDMICENGSWSHVPSCLPASRNPIYGTERRGQRIFTHSGFFVVPSGVDQVKVICIGGGGGGRDGRSFRDAGDGGNSSFGDMLVAEGGRGGKVTNSGGEGGKGTVASGGPGRLHTECGGPGGAAGETSIVVQDMFPGISSFLYCGGGGISDSECLKGQTDGSKLYTGRSGPGGKDSVGSAGGLYGGGSGGAAGGRGGGGGGYSFATIQLHSRKVITVTVGKAGSPSFARPGRGIVVVAWGGDIDPNIHNYELSSSHDVV